MDMERAKALPRVYADFVSISGFIGPPAEFREGMLSLIFGSKDILVVDASGPTATPSTCVLLPLTTARNLMDALAKSLLGVDAALAQERVAAENIVEESTR